MLGEKQFKEYNTRNTEDGCLDIREIVRVNDSEAKTIILAVSNCYNAAGFQEKGLSDRQIERLTGVNRGLVQKA